MGDSILWLEPKEHTFHTAVEAAGDGTVLTLGSKYTALLVQVTGTFSATITWKGAIGTTYVEIRAKNQNTGAVATTATAAGLYLLDVTGLDKFMADITTYASGAVTAVGRVVAVPMPNSDVTVVGALPAGSNSIGVVDTELPAAAALADGTANPTAPLVGAALEGFNGSTYDRWRNNHEVTVYSSSARTAAPTISDLTNYNARGVVVVIDVTGATDTPSVTFTIEGKSTLGSDYYTILASAAITGTGVTVLRVRPGLTAVANQTANDMIPRIWRVNVSHADSDSITYSVSANYVL